MRTRLAVVVAYTALVSGALAQGPAIEDVGGSWFFSSGGELRTGIVSSPDDGEPHFLYLNCNGVGGRTALLNLEADPKHFADAIRDGRYIVLRSRVGASTIELTVDRVVLNEAGAYPWSLQIDLRSRSILEQWSQPGTLLMELGERDRWFITHQVYRIPDQNRIAAVRSFMRRCTIPAQQ
jgi:hypothetical protein